MMSVVYVVVITPAVLTVLERPMEPIGKVTVDAFQNITLEMSVMTVLALQMVITGKVTVDAFQNIMMEMIVMIELV